MNLVLQEQILIKDIFQVVVNSTQTSGIYLPEFVQHLAPFGPNTSLVDHNTYFDSLLMQRLLIPQTDILSYLQDSWNRAEEAKSKPWNMSQKQQAFINYSIEIINNFISLSLQDPQIFPQQLPVEPNSPPAPTKNIQIARKILTHFQKRGVNKSILFIACNNCQQNFRQDFMQVLVTRQRFTTILDAKSVFYIALLVDLLQQSQFKLAFLKIKDVPFFSNKKGGAFFDTSSTFGLFLRSSLLGMRTNGLVYQQGVANQRLQQRLVDQLGNDRLTKERVKYFVNLQAEYVDKLSECYKFLMRKQTQKMFLQWNYELIISNAARMKLGNRLYNPQNSDLSHDGTLINAYSCILSLCKAITNRQDDKWKNIDPQYFRCHEKAIILKGDPINTIGSKYGEKKQFGTITQFFFLGVHLLNIGVIGALQNFNMYNEMKKNIQKTMMQVNSFPQNHPLKLKARRQLKIIQSKIVRYWVLLNDQNMISGTIKLLGLLLDLLPRWIGVDYRMIKQARLDSKGSDLIGLIPDLLLTLVSKYHTTLFSIKQGYISLVGEEHLRQLCQLTTFLISQNEIVSNPYIAAGYVQMLFSFLHDKKSALVGEALRGSEVVRRNFTFGMIRFYCGIANTGRSNQFYQKFKYRQLANKIFTSLWTQECFRQDLKLYFHTQMFQKFINQVLSDTSYSFDQSIEAYPKFLPLDSRRNSQLSQEQTNNLDMLERTLGANLQMANSNLKLIRELSGWSPQTFLTETDRRTAVPLLNNALKTFVDPASFVSDRNLLQKVNFNRVRALSDIVSIYANLNINDDLSNQIVKDGRNYKKQHFVKALQMASNQHNTSIDILQKFQQLITKLATAQNQQQNQQIYGEIPDKYLCGLMSTLMKDPVIIPGSQEVVDRVNIKRHLFNSQTNPFTRQPLKEADLISHTGLLQEIQKWKKQRLEELKIGGKGVKYGKIGVNQPEKQQGVFGNNPVIEQQ